MKILVAFTVFLLLVFLLTGCRNFEQASEQDIANASMYGTACVATNIPGWGAPSLAEQSVLVPSVPPLTVDVAYDACAASQGLHKRLTTIEARLKEIDRFFVEHNEWRKQFMAWQKKNAPSPICTTEGCFP